MDMYNIVFHTFAADDNGFLGESISTVSLPNMHYLYCGCDILMPPFQETFCEKTDFHLIELL